jgi:hypothetical protein
MELERREMTKIAHQALNPRALCSDDAQGLEGLRQRNERQRNPRMKKFIYEPKTA